MALALRWEHLSRLPSTFDNQAHNEGRMVQKLHLDHFKAIRFQFKDMKPKLWALYCTIVSGFTLFSSNALAAQPLWKLAEKHGIRIGSAVTQGALEKDPIHDAILAYEFNSLTHENVLKFEFSQPEPGRFDFREADRVMRFAVKNNQVVRGHTLVWYNQIAPWAQRLKPEDARRVLKNHVQTLIRHFETDFPGRMPVWDVINEVIDDEFKPRDHLWLRAFDGDVVELVVKSFEWAHEVAPHLKLFYNDYNIEGLDPKSDKVYAVIQEALKRGAPIHGIGFQAHLNMIFRAPTPQIEQNMARFARLGLEIHVTEIDYMTTHFQTPGERRAQSDAYADMLRLCIEQPRCTSYTTWGITDRYSWIPTQFYGPAFGHAHLWDDNYREKPVLRRLRRLLTDTAPIPRIL